MKDDRFTNPFLHYALLGSMYTVGAMTLLYHTIGHNIPVTASLFGAACKQAAVTHSVYITPAGLQPTQTILNRCDTVVFKNTDATQHVVGFGTSSKHVDYPDFASQVIQPGSSQRLTLRQKGTFDLHDYLSDKISGSITVK